MISFGTTLPELTFESKAILARHRYMALGDLIGSVVANSTLILGIVAVIHPITITNFLIFLTSSFFMITVAFLFMTFIECEKHILWQEGIALILLYILFVIIELNIRSLEILM
jgi:cation:H+ antiporter